MSGIVAGAKTFVSGGRGVTAPDEQRRAAVKPGDAPTGDDHKRSLHFQRLASTERNDAALASTRSAHRRRGKAIDGSTAKAKFANDLKEVQGTLNIVAHCCAAPIVGTD
jgi:hypothetical protein